MQIKNRGRPVGSSINWHNFEISCFVGHHLQPPVKKIQSFIKNTNDFVNKINSIKVQESLFSVTDDVKSLYKNIASNKNIAAVKEKCDNDTRKTIATKVTTTFLALILKLNNLIYHSKFQLQIKGCARDRQAGRQAGRQTNRQTGRQTDRHPLYKSKCSRSLCFIDDMVQINLKKQVECFIVEANTKHTIKLVFTSSKDKIEFRDTFPKTITIVSKQHFIKTQLTSKIISMEVLHNLFH